MVNCQGRAVKLRGGNPSIPLRCRHKTKTQKRQRVSVCFRLNRSVQCISEGERDPKIQDYFLQLGARNEANNVLNLWLNSSFSIYETFTPTSGTQQVPKGKIMLQRIFWSENNRSVRRVAFFFFRSDLCQIHSDNVVYAFSSWTFSCHKRWLDVCFSSQLSGPVVDLKMMDEFGEFAYMISFLTRLLIQFATTCPTTDKIRVLLNTAFCFLRLFYVVQSSSDSTGLLAGWWNSMVKEKRRFALGYMRFHPTKKEIWLQCKQTSRLFCDLFETF